MNSIHSRLYGHFLVGLRAHRKAKGITQEELAKRLKNRQTFVSKVERGERRIDVAEFVEIARALDSDPTQLFGGLVDSFESETAKRPRLKLRNR